MQLQQHKHHEKPKENHFWFWKQVLCKRWAGTWFGVCESTRNRKIIGQVMWALTAIATITTMAAASRNGKWAPLDPTGGLAACIYRSDWSEPIHPASRYQVCFSWGLRGGQMALKGLPYVCCGDTSSPEQRSILRAIMHPSLSLSQKHIRLLGGCSWSTQCIAVQDWASHAGSLRVPVPVLYLPAVIMAGLVVVSGRALNNEWCFDGNPTSMSHIIGLWLISFK